MVAVAVAFACCPLAGAGPVADTSRPMTPGLHVVTFDHEHGGKTTSMPYGIYLPRGIEQAAATGKKFPVVVFLAGLGARGATPKALEREGPIQLMKMRPEYEKTVPYIVVRPVIPLDQRSDNPTHARYAIAATRRVLKHYPVDLEQIHLLGLSMGGEAAWHAALEAGPDLFATIVVAMGRKHDKPDLIAKTFKDHTTLIIAGSADGDFTVGSRVMAKAFDKAGARDMIHLEVPGRGHDVWVSYVLNPRLYDWMLLHRKDGEIPKQRADAADLLKWGNQPPGDPKYAVFAKNLQKQFHKFRPWWFVEQCAMVERAGHHDELHGRKNVFVTHPLNGHVPCRLTTTAKVPAGKKTTLHLEVGHDPGGDWMLVVNLDCYAKLRRHVGRKAGGESTWTNLSIDLSPYAGKDVFIELLNRRPHRPRSDNHRALWHRIDVVSEDVPAAPAPSSPTTP